MNRLTVTTTAIGILGIIAGIIFGYPWNPPLAPHFIQACGCTLAITHATNLYLGSRTIDPSTIAKARMKLKP